MDYTAVRIPVNPVARKFYEKRFLGRTDSAGYIHINKCHFFGLKVIHYLDTWKEGWEIPPRTESMLKIALPKVYANQGITAQKLADLAKVLEAEALQFLMHEIACAAQYPGISVTNAILTVMGRYDISEEEYRTDSMRRQFDRHCSELMGSSFFEFSYAVNAAVKNIYEGMVRRYQTLS